jgi:site-specific recombinase XerD
VYTGYYYTDLKIFERKHLRRDHEYGYYMIGERDKNGNPTIIPLWKFSYAAEIIEKYQDPDPRSKYVFRREVFIDAQVYNRNVKVIAKMAGVRREVSNKTARHTNIQMWVRMGAKRPVVSRMAGHGKESTTENYYKINILEVIEGTKGADFEALNI